MDRFICPSVLLSIIGTDLGCPLHPSALHRKDTHLLKGGTWCCAPWVLPCRTLGPSRVHRWLISHEASASFALWASFLCFCSYFLKPNYKLLRAGALLCNKLIFLFTLDYFQNTGLDGLLHLHGWGNRFPELWWLSKIRSWSPWVLNQDLAALVSEWTFWYPGASECLGAAQ